MHVARGVPLLLEISFFIELVLWAEFSSLRRPFPSNFRSRIIKYNNHCLLYCFTLDIPTSSSTRLSFWYQSQSPSLRSPPENPLVPIPNGQPPTTKCSNSGHKETVLQYLEPSPPKCGSALAVAGRSDGANYLDTARRQQHGNTGPSSFQRARGELRRATPGRGPRHDQGDEIVTDLAAPQPQRLSSQPPPYSP